MAANGWFQILFYLFVIFLITKPAGVFMCRVFDRDKTFLDPVLRPIERLIYRLTGIDEKQEMRWTEYAVAMLLFSGVSMALLYLIERTQKWLPFNPQHLPNLEPGLAFGTAASFTTNTNWQSYCLLWVLLPVCLVGSLALVSQGVVQNLKSYTIADLTDPQTVQVTGADGKTTLQRVTQQVIAQGPVASQEVIKEFGTNGGGFFNANSAHPFENTGRKPKAIRSSWAQINVRMPCNQAEIWKERKCGLESRALRFLPRLLRMPAAARSTACTIPTRHLVA